MSDSAIDPNMPFDGIWRVMVIGFKAQQPTFDISPRFVRYDVERRQRYGQTDCPAS